MCDTLLHFLSIYFDAPFLACLIQLNGSCLHFFEDCLSMWCITVVQSHVFTHVHSSIQEPYFLHYKVKEDVKKSWGQNILLMGLQL